MVLLVLYGPFDPSSCTAAAPWTWELRKAGGSILLKRGDRNPPFPPLCTKISAEVVLDSYPVQHGLKGRAALSKGCSDPFPTAPPPAHLHFPQRDMGPLSMRAPPEGPYDAPPGPLLSSHSCFPSPSFPRSGASPIPPPPALPCRSEEGALEEGCLLRPALRPLRLP